jgi:hypothetical protein
MDHCYACLNDSSGGMGSLPRIAVPLSVTFQLRFTEALLP